MDLSKFTDKKFDAIKFVMDEKLSPDLWNQSPKKKGLVLVATKVDSVPKDIVIPLPLDMKPVEFIKELSLFENIKSEDIDSLIEKLKETKEEVTKLKSE